MRIQKNKTASILIFSLWILSFMTIVTVQIGMSIRQRASLLSRLEDRSQLHYLASSGVKKAVSAIRTAQENNSLIYTSEFKEFVHNNKKEFQGISVGRNNANVYHVLSYSDLGKPQKRFGVIDEERKININLADIKVLEKLFLTTITSNEDDAKFLSEAIVDWREIGSSQITSFYSDDYYSNLEFPYDPKNAYFEFIDELVLVQGFNESLVNDIKPYLTVHGQGYVNINTAPREVLFALGFSNRVIDKIIEVRKGEDLQEATEDDYVFLKTFDIASEMSEFVELELEEIKEIDYINSLGLLTTNSFYFNIRSFGKITGKKQQFEVACVYNSIENRFEIWNEK